jgi:hypothetical protein
LSGIQFSTLKSAGINDSEGTEKYHNTEMKYGATFCSCLIALDSCFYKVVFMAWGFKPYFLHCFIDLVT